MREHWREPHYWLWLWRHRAPFEAKAVITTLVVAGLVGGGWLVADRLTAAHAEAGSSKPYVLQTTIHKLVTVREHGKVVQKLVPVVKKIVERGKVTYRTRLNYSTRVVTAPVQLVTRTARVVVPVVRRRVITVNGKPVTVTTSLAPTTHTETAVQTETVTSTQSVTQSASTSTITTARTSTVTQTQTATQTQTVTTTGPAETIFSTVTETVTVTRPPKG